MAVPAGLIRGMGLGSATALNMIDMIGVGPFITMPLVLSRHGRTADHGWDVVARVGGVRRAGGRRSWARRCRASGGPYRLPDGDLWAREVMGGG